MHFQLLTVIFKTFQLHLLTIPQKKLEMLDKNILIREPVSVDIHVQITAFCNISNTNYASV